MIHPSSSSSSLRMTNSPLISHRRKKKPKIHAQDSSSLQIQWRSDRQQQIYSSKLLQALRRVRSPNKARETADRVLAATAMGRTRWSRAILTNRLKLKFMKRNSMVKRQRRFVSVIANRPRNKSNLKISSLKSKSWPAVQRKARVLSRLVPGCRKEPFPVVLEEATDYIAALQMQVRAMSELAELLSAAATASTAAADGGDSSSARSGN